MFKGKFAQDEITYQKLRVGSKKHALSLPEGSVQSCPESCRREGCSRFCAWSVRVVREHGTMTRTPLAAFFNRPHVVIGYFSVGETMSEVFTQDSSNFSNMNQKKFSKSFFLYLSSKSHPYRVLAKLTNLFNTFPRLPNSSTPRDSNTLSPSEGWTILWVGQV